ncbi:MAG: OmpA family protein, partial [Candidatus Kapaibacterium sp.]
AKSEDLGKRRALVVRNYLVDTWTIQASRIAVEQRGLPTQVSNESDPDGPAENRRVEISSSDPSILSAVASNDTMRVFDPPAVRFNLDVSSGSRLKSWTLFVSESDHIIKTFHGSGAPPANVDWRIAEQARFIPLGTRNLDFMLVVQDSNGTVIPTETGSIPVSEVTIADKRSGGGTDKSVDRFSLILFGFDESDVTPDQQPIISSIKKRITPTSTVSITGYTDRSGTDDYNKRLSEQRARAVSTALSVPRSTVTGQGETLPLYDNETPEGRFYSRTVEVIVETPMK